MRTTGNTIVVTGGASGIGLAIARELHARGNTVVVLGRNLERLGNALETAPGLHAMVCDITDEAGVRETLRRIALDHPRFNVLVNCAGISRACRFVEDPGALALARAEVETNLLGTLTATKLALPYLRRHGEAAIVTVSSGIALAPHLAEPTHSATKAALHAFTQCLRHQLAGTPVRVIEVLPPLTDTALTRHVVGAKVSPEAVARATVKGLAADRPEVRIGLVRLLGLLARLSPSLAARVVTGSATTPQAALEAAADSP